MNADIANAIAGELRKAFKQLPCEPLRPAIQAAKHVLVLALVCKTAHLAIKSTVLQYVRERIRDEKTRRIYRLMPPTFSSNIFSHRTASVTQVRVVLKLGVFGRHFYRDFFFFPDKIITANGEARSDEIMTDYSLNRITTVAYSDFREQLAGSKILVGIDTIYVWTQNEPADGGFEAYFIAKCAHGQVYGPLVDCKGLLVDRIKNRWMLLK